MDKIMKIILLIPLLCLFGCSSLQELDNSLEKNALNIQIAHNSLIVADWAQTRFIATNNHYKEDNKHLGKNPTIEQVNRFFIREMIIQNSIPLIAPKPWRKYWHIVGSVYRYDFVQKNHSIGIDFKF
jgi:hypothetical protein